MFFPHNHLIISIESFLSASRAVGIVDDKLIDVDFVLRMVTDT